MLAMVYQPSVFAVLLGSALLATPLLSRSDQHDDEPDSKQELDISLILTYETHHHALAAEAAEDLPAPGFSAELELEQSYKFSRSLNGFLNASLISEQEKFEGNSQSASDEYAQLDQLWLQWTAEHDRLVSVRAGRQSFLDARGWWWDDELDAVSIQGSTGRIDYLAGLGRSSDAPRIRSLPNDPEFEDVRWLLGSLHYRLDGQAQLGAYFTARRDFSSRYEAGQQIDPNHLDEQDDELAWLGLSWQQSVDFAGGNLLEFEAQGIFMSGKLNRVNLQEDQTDDDADGDEAGNDEDESTADTENDGATIASVPSISVDAWAISTWAHWTPAFLSKHRLSAGYSIGSGTKLGDPEGSGTFKQTGLQSNELDRNYYGEILDLELSNLHVATVKISGSFYLNTGYSLTHHRYFRDSVHDDTLESNFEFDLDSGGRRLGYETSVNLFFESDIGITTELNLARFMTTKPDSDGRREPVHYLEIELSYEF